MEDWRSKYDIFSILDAIIYIDITGCQWRNLPSEYPKWPTVYYKKVKGVKRHIVTDKNGCILAATATSANFTTPRLLPCSWRSCRPCILESRLFMPTLGTGAFWAKLSMINWAIMSR